METSCYRLISADMIDEQFAEEFAGEWEKAWNLHNLEEILSHYFEDFQMTSPFIPSAMNEPSGTLKGRLASTGVKRWTVFQS